MYFLYCQQWWVFIYSINSVDAFGKFDLGQMLAKLIIGAAFYIFVLWLVKGKNK